MTERLGLRVVKTNLHGSHQLLSLFFRHGRV